MAKRQKSSAVTKKTLARVAREQRQRRLLITGTIVVIALVFLVIAFGVINENMLKPQKTMMQLGDETITVKQFQDRAKFERLQLVNQYLSTYQYLNSFDDPNTRAFFENSLKQIAFQLDPLIFGQTVIDKLTEDLIIRQEAKKRGIVITKEEVDLRLKAEFGYFPQGTPTPRPTFAELPTSTLSPTQIALLPPTPTITATENLTDSVETSPTPTTIAPTSTPYPTSTPITEEAYQQNLQIAIDNLEQEMGIGEQFLRDYFEAELYRQRLRDVITADVEPFEEQVWARHILVEDEETAKEIYQRLINGEDFAQLAQEFSQDPGSAAQGGDLDWFGRGRMAQEFEDAAFSLSIGEISEPVQTSFGWHIIQVLGHENRPLTEIQFEQKKNEVFQNWLNEMKQQVSVDIDENWGSYVPSEPSIPPQFLIP